jgi:hypothetical protein
MSAAAILPCLLAALLTRWFFLPEARGVSQGRAILFGLVQAATAFLFFSPSWDLLIVALGHGVVCTLVLLRAERRGVEAPGTRLLLLFAHLAAAALCLRFTLPLEWFALRWNVRMPAVLPVVWLTGALLCLKESNFFVRWFFTRIRGNAEKPTPNQEQKVRAETGNGRVIGSLERLLIYVLLLAGQPVAVPVVVAVKALARFKRMEEDQAFAEYVIIGTFLSMLLTLAAYGLVRAAG